MKSKKFIQLRKNSRNLSNVLQLPEDGSYGAKNCLTLLNLNRRTKLHLTIEWPIFCRRY